jgi:hypothetical protein
VTEASVPTRRLVEALAETGRVLAEHELPYVTIGALAAALHLDAEPHDDVDVLVRPEDAATAVDRLVEAGFERGEAGPDWLHKVRRGPVVVDVVFRPSGGLQLDEAMRARAVVRRFARVDVAVASPEDQIVLLAAATRADAAHYWHQALEILRRRPPDWAYLQRRSLTVPDRAASLLLFARSTGQEVPLEVVDELLAAVHRR